MYIVQYSNTRLLYSVKYLLIYYVETVPRLKI